MQAAYQQKIDLNNIKLVVLMQIYRLDQILRNAALGILVYPPLHADNTITTLQKESLWYCMHCHTVSLHMETNDNLLYKNLVSFFWGYNGF